MDVCLLLKAAFSCFTNLLKASDSDNKPTSDSNFVVSWAFLRRFFDWQFIPGIVPYGSGVLLEVIVTI